LEYWFRCRDQSRDAHETALGGAQELAWSRFIGSRIGCSFFVLLIALNSVAHGKETANASNPLYDPFLASQREDAELHSLFPLSSDRLWAVGDRGLILSSEDGGIRWKQQESGTTFPLRDVYFADPMRGWAVGYGIQPFSRRPYGILLMTSDGGKKWNYVPQPFLPPLHGICRTESGNLIVWGGWSIPLGSSVFESIDMGRTWSPSPHIETEFSTLSPLGQEWVGLQPDGRAFRWALPGGRILEPKQPWQLFCHSGEAALGLDKAGQIWIGDVSNLRAKQNVALPVFLSGVTAMYRQGNMCLLAGKPAKNLARSMDAGQTWQLVENPVTTPLKRFYFIDEHRGWALSEFGHILATRDGGQSWWIQRSNFRRLGVLFLVAAGENIPWNTIAYCANELQRSTSLLILEDEVPNPFESHSARRRIEAAASAVGVNQVHFISQAMSTDVSPAIVHKNRAAWLDDIEAFIAENLPEVIVIGEDQRTGPAALKEVTLSIVLDRSQISSHQKSTELKLDMLPKIHKVFAVTHSNARSLEISNTQVLKRSGKILGDVAQRATLLCESQVELDRSESLLLIYCDHPEEGVGSDIARGFISSPDAAREIELGNQSNLQVVLGSTARRKSLQRLLDSSRRESRDESWDEYFRQVVDTLTRDELEISLVWLANRLREQGKWLHWQMVAETLIRRQPDSGAAEVMWHHILTVAASGELNYWRERESRSNRQNPPTTDVVTASANTSDSPPTSPFAKESITAVSPSVEHSPLPEDDADLAKIAGDQANSTRPMNQALMYWIMEQLPLRHPMLITEPEVLLQLSSWFRRYDPQASMVADIQTGLKNISQQSYPSIWNNAALVEYSFWSTTAGKTHPSVPGEMDSEASKVYFGKQPSAAYPTTDRPLLDGLADDLCWRHAEVIHLNGPLDSLPKTEARIVFDDEWIFLWIHCERDSGSKRSQAAKQRSYDSELSAEDRVKIMLDVDRDRNTLFQFEVDQRGLTRDTCWGLTPWNPRWFVAQQHTETFWNSEIAIPISELTSTTRLAGSHWCFGLERQSGQRPLGHWPKAFGKSLEARELGILRFMTAPSGQPPTIR
jgi:photosystem II stability/assembly factor-like uncharacterized protein